MESRETPAPVYPLAALLGELEEDARRRAESRAAGIARGPVTGIGCLDRMLGGCLEPGIHVLHGEAGTGKTALALSIAASCGAPALFVSAEMGRLELLRRLIARETGTYLTRLKSGEFSPEEMRSLASRAAAASPSLALMDATTAGAPAEHIAASARRLREALPAGALGVLVVIDSAHAWSSALPDLRQSDEYERLQEALERLRLLSASLSAALLVIAERTKAGGEGLNASAGTRGFSYKAETVLGLDKGEERAGPGPIPVTLRLLKNRQGECGRLSLMFDGATMRHTETIPEAGGFVSVPMQAPSGKRGR